jgi:hypothetical protein
MKTWILIGMLMLAGCITKVIILPGGGTQVCVICDTVIYCS